MNTRDDPEISWSVEKSAPAQGPEGGAVKRSIDASFLLRWSEQKRVKVLIQRMNYLPKQATEEANDDSSESNLIFIFKRQTDYHPR